jgi:hypothetical protein
MRSVDTPTRRVATTAKRGILHDIGILTGVEGSAKVLSLKLTSVVVAREWNKMDKWESGGEKCKLRKRSGRGRVVKVRQG